MVKLGVKYNLQIKITIDKQAMIDIEMKKASCPMLPMMNPPRKFPTIYYSINIDQNIPNSLLVYISIFAQLFTYIP